MIGIAAAMTLKHFGCTQVMISDISDFRLSIANTTMGIVAIATFLNNSGYKRKLRQNNTIEGFSTSFVKGVFDNPVYCGKLAFGRRKNEKIPGTRNEYHVVEQDNYMLNDGIHEAIVSEELWNQVHKKGKKPVLPISKLTVWITSIFYLVLLNVRYAVAVCMAM